MQPCKHLDFSSMRPSSNYEIITEEMYKKDLHDQDNHNGVISHLEADILECEIKWALESITITLEMRKLIYQLT